MQSTNSTDTLPLTSPVHDHFHFLIVRAIQRSGVSYKAQRRACDAIDTVLSETICGATDEQAKEIAARCLHLTRPVYYKPRKKRPQPQHPWTGRRDTLVIALMREAAVVHLREHQNLSFREISKRLSLRGPELVRHIYARACRRRDQLVCFPCAPEPAPMLP